MTHLGQVPSSCSSSIPDGTLPSLPSGGSNQQAVAVENRTGGWTADLGGDGPLDITVVCVGDGELAVDYHSRSRPLGSFTLPCDATISNNYDDAVPSGRITVYVKPDGGQLWSARLARSPES